MLFDKGSDLAHDSAAVPQAPLDGGGGDRFNEPDGERGTAAVESPGGQRGVADDAARVGEPDVDTAARMVPVVIGEVALEGCIEERPELSCKRLGQIAGVCRPTRHHRASLANRRGPW